VSGSPLFIFKARHNSGICASSVTKGPRPGVASASFSTSASGPHPVQPVGRARSLPPHRIGGGVPGALPSALDSRRAAERGLEDAALHRRPAGALEHRRPAAGPPILGGCDEFCALVREARTTDAGRSATIPPQSHSARPRGPRGIAHRFQCRPPCRLSLRPAPRHPHRLRPSARQAPHLGQSRLLAAPCAA
jgi:hypothetical protein